MSIIKAGKELRLESVRLLTVGNTEGKMRAKKKLMVLVLSLVVMFALCQAAFAQSEESVGPSKDVATQDSVGILVSSSRTLTLPSPYGTLTSNCWRQTGGGTISGNQLLWDYQVSAVYEGSFTVARIRTTWWSSASLRNGASINLGIAGSGASAGFSLTWQTVTTPTRFWENSNGARTSSWRSNIVVGPRVDYRAGTITTTNTALIQLVGDARVWEISAGV